MKNNKSFLGLFLATLIFLPGCIHVPVYKSKSLTSMETKFTYYHAEKDIIVQAKELTIPEVEYLFGSRTQQLVNNNVALYFSIHNFSKVDYTIAPKDIAIESLAYNDVITIIKKTNTVSRFAGTAICASIPLLFVNTWMEVAFFQPLLLIPCLATTVIAIPTGVILLVESIKSAVMNRRIKKDVKEKMLDKKIMIKSGDHYEGLIFVPSSDYQPDFTVIMHEKKNTKNNVIFNVNLNHI